jgi:hypothetical protein
VRKCEKTPRRRQVEVEDSRASHHFLAMDEFSNCYFVSSFPSSFVWEAEDADSPRSSLVTMHCDL